MRFPRLPCATQTSDFDPKSGLGPSSVPGAVPAHSVLKDGLLRFAAARVSRRKGAATAGRHRRVHVAGRAMGAASKAAYLSGRYGWASANEATLCRDTELFKEPWVKSVWNKKKSARL